MDDSEEGTTGDVTTGDVTTGDSTTSDVTTGDFTTGTHFLLKTTIIYFPVKERSPQNPQPVMILPQENPKRFLTTIN